MVTQNVTKGEEKMAVQQPSDIPRPWASNGGQFTQIPDTTSDAGRASWSQGFPPETSLPVAQGGIPPNRLDFQGVLNALSAHTVFKQAGGTYAWNNATAYPKGAIVLYTDGKLYCATTDTNAGDLPTGSKWTAVVLGNATGNFVTQAALAQALSAYLLKSGGTMTGNLGFAAGQGITTANSARLNINGAGVAMLEDIPDVPSLDVNIANGYARIGAMQIEWGTATSQTTRNFPVAFSSVPVVVASMSGGRNPACVTSITSTNFYVDNANLNDSDGDNTTTLYWIAIGPWS